MPFILTRAIFWIAVACCTVAQIAIIRSAILSPARIAGGKPASGARHAAEIAWAALPGIALAVVLVCTWRVIRAQPGSLAVNVGRLR
jgi:heme/copper-type cytochrome/quinol oxidase subunit 2